MKLKLSSQYANHSKTMVIRFAINRIATTMLMLFCIHSLLISQNATFTKNITLPDETGGFGADFVEVNGKIFVHGQSEVYVYQRNSSTNEMYHVTTIDLKSKQFTTNSDNTSKSFGKYAPPYFNYGFHSPSRQMMVVSDASSPLIYTITPDINLISINTNTYEVTKLKNRPALIDHFKISSGRVIIKYDGLNNRLYTLFSGRDEVNKDGSFHITDSYFAVYDINNTNGSLTLKCEEFKRGFDEYNGVTGDGYLSTANEIEPYRSLGSNLFYIARKKKIVLYELTTDPTDPYAEVESISIPEAKIGKMITIKNANLHKIVVLPYMLPGSGIEPDPFTYTVQFYIFEAGSTAMTYQSLNAPSRRIIDGHFISQRNTLVLTFPNHYSESEPLDPYCNDAIFDGKNLAFFTYSSNTFSLDPSLSLNTNCYTYDWESKYFNYPLKIVPGNDNDFYLGSINEWTHVTYNTIPDPAVYEFETIIDKPGSFFGTGAVLSDYNCALSYTLNGLYNSYQDGAGIHHTDFKPVGFPAYHSVYNPTNNLIYFYNTISNSNSTIYVYDPLANGGEGALETTIDVEFPIGDIVYNPFQDHLLISANDDVTSTIYRIDSDNNYEQTDIPLGGKTYTKKMFVAPSGLLCVFTNTTNNSPSMMFFNASNYQYTTNPIVNLTNIENNVNCHFNASFCYNQYDHKVYATVRNDNILLNPYFSQENVCEMTSSFGEGLLLSITDNGEVSTLNESLINPGKVICPELLDQSEDYQGALYILTNEDLYTNNIAYYDCSTDIIESIDLTPAIHFNDIVYNQHTNSVFAFSDQTETTPSTGEFAHDRIARFYQIEKTYPTGFNVAEIGNYEGQIASFFNNPYNGKIYVHTKFSQNKWGDEPAKLLEYDPTISGSTFEEINLFEENGPQITSYYVEYDHYEDALINFLNCNLTTPYIDPYQNKMYLPNGAHSKISVVDFDAEELLLLNNKGHDWISIPRLYQQGAGPSINNVLAGNIVPQDYIEDSELLNWPPDADQEYSSFYDLIEGWPTPQEIGGIYSERGYKLDLLYTGTTEPKNKYIKMYGDVIPTTTQIPLFERKPNWVGYFIHKEQDVLDALGQVLWYTNSIKGEDWFCYFDGPARDPGNPVPTSAGWICDNLVHNIDYGDMIVINTDLLPENYTFSWVQYGTKNAEIEEEIPQNFVYSETADYDPIVILLDTTETIDEIGAFIGDSCVGACVVSPNDTLVGIKAYTDELTGDSITFQTWSNTKSTQKKIIHKYGVYNKEKRIYETRSIHPSENSSIYKVSFRQDNYIEPDHIKTMYLRIYPNPAANNVSIEYNVESHTNVNITIYDGTGRFLATLFNSQQTSGYSTYLWDLTVGGKKLNKGVYIIKLAINNNTITKKVIIQ